VQPSPDAPGPSSEAPDVQLPPDTKRRRKREKNIRRMERKANKANPLEGPDDALLVVAGEGPTVEAPSATPVVR